jgi:P27 family predicted phage terminase small subunit
MGKRGPPPLPTAEKKRRGTHQPSRTAKNEAQPRGRPYAPRWLSSYARAEWNRIVPELVRVGLATRIDRAVLTGYCEAWATLKEAVELRRKHGIYVISGTGTPTTAPWVRVQKDAAAQVVRFAAEMGMSASARSRVEAITTPGAAEAGADDDYFGPQLVSK